MLKHGESRAENDEFVPAAFRRLCVETGKERTAKTERGSQPPSGGCVLKQLQGHIVGVKKFQPPSGGCVLKPVVTSVGMALLSQPPSGGCVLKLNRDFAVVADVGASRLQAAVC